MGTRCAEHVIPLYPQKLALTSPTGGGRSVGIVRVRTKATEFSFSFNLWNNVHEEVSSCVSKWNYRRQINMITHPSAPFIRPSKYTVLINTKIK